MNLLHIVPVETRSCTSLSNVKGCAFYFR